MRVQGLACVSWGMRALALLLGASWCAEARAFEELPATVVFQAESGWTYHAAVQGGEVIGYLAEHTNPLAVPNGLSVVWYQRTGGSYAITSGWTGVASPLIAASIALELESPELFQHSEIGWYASNLIDACDVVAFESIPIENGLAVGDPLGGVAVLLEPAELQAYVEGGAVGADVLSAAEIDMVVVNGVEVSIATAQLGWLTEMLETELAGGDPQGILGSICIPGVRCRSVTVVGPCTLTGGFGNGSCSGCKYSCTATTIKVCAHFDLFCNVGPATTTTTTGTVSKTCPGNASACPPSPPPGC